MPPRFEILPALPIYGPHAVAFTETGKGTHREGLVVRVWNSHGTDWVGNFQPGLGGLSAVFPHPNGRELIVVARGQGYVVDPDDQTKRDYLDSDIDAALELEELGILVLGNGLWLEAIGPRGRLWKADRLSWDGMRNIELRGQEIHGEAWSPIEDSWMPFTVDVATGRSTGGSYTDPGSAG